MSTASDRKRLREALETSGSAWIFQYWGNDADKNLDKVLADLKRFEREYHKRFGEKPDPFALLEVNPTKGAAFFQIDTLMVSTAMKVMIWRILLGCEVARVKFNYDAGKSTALSVVLSSPYGDDEQYVGQPGDYRVLRHFGITGVDDSLVLQGYYAARGI